MSLSPHLVYVNSFILYLLIFVLFYLILLFHFYTNTRQRDKLLIPMRSLFLTISYVITDISLASPSWYSSLQYRPQS